ncbi:hypothetical protein [Paenibacillus silvisoli]|uniref:hypothetical protein n=1 Tax=Paenibacillus silvisoli TaxID=3110539 RepID=UPI002806337F|nr:hypothetical protein [Paenibacillus silvisoli]
MMNVIATSIVLLLAGSLVAAMIYIMRLSTDDSGKHPEIKQFVDSLFGGTASPVQSQPEAQQAQAEKESAAALASDDASGDFDDECPACSEPITKRHRECPSCGLRFL